MTAGWMAASDALCGCVRVLAALYLLAVLLPVGRPGGRRLAAGGIGALTIVVLSNVVELPEYWRMAAEVILIAACAGLVPSAGKRPAAGTAPSERKEPGAGKMTGWKSLFTGTAPSERKEPEAGRMTGWKSLFTGTASPERKEPGAGRMTGWKSLFTGTASPERKEPGAGKTSAAGSGRAPGRAGQAGRPDLRMCLYLAIFYEIAAAFWQFLFRAGAGILLRLPGLPPARSLAGQLGAGLTHLILAAVTAGVWRLAADGEAEAGGRGGERPVMAVTLAGFLAVITLSEQTVLAIPEDTLFMWTILAVVLMMAVLVFRISRQYEMERELAELKSGQAKLLERDYTALRDTYAVSAKLFHDFHNHIGALRQLLVQEKYAEAVQYLDELQAPVRGLAETVWTGDGAADYLINSRLASAPEAGIRFEVRVEFPRHTDLKSADLCAILGNLLDNAMEAAGQAQEEAQRFVRLTIRRIHQMLVIKVENGYSTTIIEKDGQLQTTKATGGLHGWGLKSAQTAAEKYDGTVRTARGEGVFTAVATLSFTGMDTGADT